VSNDHPGSLTPEEALQMLEEHPQAVLVDIREDHEWLVGHAVEARHLGKGILERDLESRFPDKETELILYCGGGFRSALAADNLQQMGYTNVLSMDGGWRAWTEAGLPIEGLQRAGGPEPSAHGPA